MANATVGQSGGPTSVINASLVGVFQASQMRGAKHVYGMLHGIQGPRLHAVRGRDIQRHAYHQGIANYGTLTRLDVGARRQAAGTFRTLSASVAARLRKHKLLGTCIQISVRDKDLMTYEHQRMLFEPTNSERVIYENAMELFDESYDWHSAVRSVGVRCTKLIPEGSGIQMSIFSELEKGRDEDGKLSKVIDDINRRFGTGTVKSCAELEGIMSPNYDPDFYDGGITEGKRNPFQ